MPAINLYARIGSGQVFIIMLITFNHLDELRTIGLQLAVADAEDSREL